MKAPTQMLILDFSGTLSLGATQFGRPENLIRALKQSGLWQLGLDSVETFWEEIVNPTWTEGSTTPKGYKRLITERVGQLSEMKADRPTAATHKAEAVRASAAKFVDNYLEQSAIAPDWAVVIRRFLSQPELLVVIATDHYAEATTHILSQLTRLGLEVAPALQADCPRQVLVANSADVGHHKASRAFWERLKQTHGLAAISKIVIVDDFGLNEQQFDRYAEAAKVKRRMHETVELLSTVFEAQIGTFPFFLPDDPDQATADAASLDSKYKTLIGQVGKFIEKFLGEQE